MKKQHPIPEEVQYIAGALNLGEDVREIMFHAGQLAYEAGRSEKAEEYLFDFIYRCKELGKEEEKAARERVYQMFEWHALKQLVKLNVFGFLDAHIRALFHHPLTNKLVKYNMVWIEGIDSSQR